MPRRPTSAVATIACYGPTPGHATKLVASIVAGPGAQVIDSRVWSTLSGDVREDSVVSAEVRAYIDLHGVSRTISAPRLLGCPHQQGIDYAEGQECERCPAWAAFDRFTGRPRMPGWWSAAVVLAVLSTPGHIARSAAILAADEYRHVIAEAVVKRLERITDDPDDVTEGDGSLITDGLFLCARWRDERAYRPLVAWLRTATSADLDLLGDVLTQDGGRILAGVWGGDLEPLQRLIETPTADEFARAAGLNALALLVAWEEVRRDTVVAYFGRLATDGLDRTAGQVWDSLAVESAEIEALEVFPLLRAAYAEGLIDQRFVPESELDEVEAAPRGATLQALRERWPPVLDVLRELSWAEPVRYQPSPPARHVDSRKVGRNEPCPCGSGRKYKKCCGG